MKTARTYMIFLMGAGATALLLTGWRAAEQDPSQWYVDFDTSLQTEQYPQRIIHPEERKFYEAFKQVYEKNNIKQVTCEEQPKIPKIIHQIWLGSALPDEYRSYQASWQRFHPDWEYRLWTDADLANFPMQNRTLFDASNNYGEKSDIARYEILYQLGGLYVDTDYECLKPFDMLHHCYDFYIGIQPLDTNYMQLGIGIIGSVAGHPLLKSCLANLARNAEQHCQIIQRTGPIYFTRIFASLAPYVTDATVALPPTYFYPRGYNQTKSEQALWQRPESFAVHHWAGSWLKKDAFVKGSAKN